MLDIQRSRAAILKTEVVFTRRILAAHLMLGFAIVVFMLAHGLWVWSAGAALWYLLSILPVRGMMSASDFSRHVLGALFLLFSVSGVVFLTQTFPGLASGEEPGLLPLGLLPFWLGFLNLVYAVAGFCMILHRYVGKAVRIGFTLW